MKQYTLSQAQSLVSDAVKRSQSRHTWWKALERLFQSGSTGGLNQAALNGTLFDGMSESDLETVNLVLPRVQLMIARLTSRDPRPIAQSMSGSAETENQERLVEAILEFYFQKGYGVSVIKDLAQDLVVCGNGFAKVLWDFEEEDVELSAEEKQEQLDILNEMERKAALMEGRAPLPSTELETIVPKTVKRVISDEPIFRYVRPYDIFLPASARRIHESRWIAQRIIVPIEEAQDRYPKHEFTASSIGSQEFLDHENGRDQEEELVVLYEFWDRATRTLMVFTEDGDKACFEGEFPYSHDDFPYVHIANHRTRPSDFWAFGDLQQMASLQERFNEIWTRILDSTYRSGRKYLATTGSLTEDAVTALESEDDDIVVFVDGPMGENPANLIAPLFRQPISGEVLNTQQSLVQLMDQVVAFSDFDNGGVGADRMSATAAAAVMGVTEQRALTKQLLLEEAGSRIYTLMLALLQEFLTEETAVRIAGPNGVNWQRITGGDLSGEFRIRVETGSMNGETRAARRAEGNAILTQIVPTLAGLGYDTDGLVRSAMKKLDIDPAEIALQKMGPPPMEAGPEALPTPGMSSEMMGNLTGLQAPIDAQGGGDLVV